MHAYSPGMTELLTVASMLQVCHIAERSIRSVLSTNNNAQDLLNLHVRPRVDAVVPDATSPHADESPGRAVVTK